jgi:two-component system CheB/CheR fusion protein
MSKVQDRVRTPRRLVRLRERAEALLMKSPAAVSASRGADVQKLVHELGVHQVELEMQNEELRQVRLELENSLDRFARLYDLAPVGYLTLDAAGLIHEVNLTAARLLGVDRPGLLKKQFSRFVATQSLDDYNLHIRQVFADAGRESCELQMQRASGKGFTGRLESVVETGRSDLPAHCLLALSDVTRRRQAENAMRASQAQLAGIIRSAMDAIITVNQQQRIVLCNEAAERMFGRASGKLTGLPLGDLIPKAARPMPAPDIRSFNPTGATTRRMAGLGRVSGLRADGTEFPIEASISQIERDDEKFFTVILRDISQRMRAEETLRQNEAALEDFFTGAPLGLLWVGADGCILRVNRAQLELMGCAEEEVLGRSIAGFLADPDAADALDRLEKKETLNTRRALLRRKDGSTRHVLIDANGLWAQGRLVHSRWFVRDITTRIKLQAELLQIGERERQRIGHDLHDGLGQQLHGLSYLAELLEKSLREDASPHAAQIHRLNRYLSEALELTRGIAHGLQPVKAVPEGLMLALRELAGRTRRVYRVDCRFTCRKPVPIHRQSAATHLYRIAQEAVNNAIKHGKSTRIRIMLAATPQQIILGIRDNGGGIRDRAKRSQGMGLHVMQYRADAIGGSLVVQNLPERGTEAVCTVTRQALLPAGNENQ